MGRLVGVVMLLAVSVALYQLVRGSAPVALRVGASITSIAPICLGLLRVFPNAVELGAREGTPAHLSMLARSICYEHLLCLASIGTFVALVLVAARREDLQQSAARL
jgi:hypothetical protein